MSHILPLLELSISRQPLPSSFSISLCVIPAWKAHCGSATDM